MNKKDIENGFLRQVANLSTYMNAYSMTLTSGLLSTQEYDNLYDILTKINSKKL